MTACEETATGMLRMVGYAADWAAVMKGSDPPMLIVLASTPLSPAPLPPAAVLTFTFEYVWVKFVAQSWKSGKSNDEPASEIGLAVAVKVAGRTGCATVVAVKVVFDTAVDVVIDVDTDVAVETDVDTEVAVDTDVAVDVSVMVVAVPDIVVTVTVAGLLAVETAVLVTVWVTVDFEPEEAA